MIFVVEFLEVILLFFAVVLNFFDVRLQINELLEDEDKKEGGLD
jgi:hypothetical protein